MAGKSWELNNLKQERAEIDTSSPFSSVKAAVSLFGEKAHFKERSTSSSFSAVKDIKHGAKEGVELRKMEEELTSLKLQLMDTEKAKEKAFMGLRDAKKLLEEFTVQQNCNAWEAQVKVVQEQPRSAVSELGSTRRKLEIMKQGYVASVDNKESMQVEECTSETSGANESVLTCIEANDRGACFEGKKKRSVCFPEGVAAVQELEVKLATASEELKDLRQELIAAKAAEEEVARAAAEAFIKLEQAKLELEDVRNASNTSSCATSQTIKMAGEDLDKVLESGASLQATLQALQVELENMRKELEHLRQREVNASAVVLGLRSELTRKKSELKVASATELKANEAVASLSQTLDQRTCAAQEAKESVFASREEASQARLHVDQAKPTISASKGDVHGPMAGTEAAKKAVLTSSKMDKTVMQDRQVKVDAGSAISQKEHSASEESYHLGQGHDYRAVAINAHVLSMQGGEAQETVNEDRDVTVRDLVHESEIIEESNDSVDSEAKHWKVKDMDVEGTIGARAFYEEDYSVSGDHWSYQRHYTEVEEQGVPNQTSGHKKKKHLLSSLSSLLGRKSSQSPRMYTP